MSIHSSFWLGDKNFNRLKKKDDLSPLELARYQRSIGKFVKILTKENIPVEFQTHGSSHTDGESVTISSTINEHNFDSVVGLALHEGSHIVLTDFSILPNYESKVQSLLMNRFDIYGTERDEWVQHLVDERKTFQGLLNYVEDRRIDYYIYTNSPGYKGYYEAMYDRYFNDRIIDKAIASDKFTDVTVESYMFRIINFLNENTRFDALPDLKKMYDLIFDNVSTMNDTTDAMEIAFKIYKNIIENVEKAEAEAESDESNEKDSDQQKDEGQSQSSNSTSNDSSEEDGMNSSMDGEGDSMEESDNTGGGSDGNDESEESGGDSQSSESGSDSDDESGEDGQSSGGGTGEDETDEDNEDEKSDGSGADDENKNEENNDGNCEENSETEDSNDETGDGSNKDETDSNKDEDESEKDKKSDRPKLTERQERLLPKKMQKQEDFLDGNISKGKINKSTKQLVDALATADVSNEEVEYEGRYYDEDVDVAVVRGLNDNTIDLFKEIRNNRKRVDAGYTDGEQQAVSEGFKLGKRLGKKLQIRNRDRTTTYNRQKKGKLDKRRIHALGTDNRNVFNQYRTEKHEDAFIHLSIDGSGSMHGNKLSNSIKSAVAIAQMADMTNIEVEISMRYTDNSITGEEQPVLWVIYDSRKESIKTVKKYFKYLTTMGITPEGLCFDAVMDQLPVGTNALKTYFINYSDGMPNFGSYGSEGGRKHTRRQVEKMKKKGYKILSFFITESSGGYGKENFEDMYGKNSSFIDPTELNKLVKTLQKMFMKR